MKDDKKMDSINFTISKSSLVKQFIAQNNTHACIYLTQTVSIEIDD